MAFLNAYRQVVKDANPAPTGRKPLNLYFLAHMAPLAATSWQFHKKNQFWPFVDLAPCGEIIYKTPNHASGRREIHPSAEHDAEGTVSRADSGNDRTRILMS
ncbi:hypothetical protein [Martelella alba]|uniref:hypothetical protein n=1 Tax=Martelella alba TaxID=2590451 RepID=UPI0015E8747D|nr:hypothetical protein [Martelella alba]